MPGSGQKEETFEDFAETSITPNELVIFFSALTTAARLVSSNEERVEVISKKWLLSAATQDGCLSIFGQINSKAPGVALSSTLALIYSLLE